ncbi:MAG: hypothetical protein PHC88_07160 [Terrimicrobiaceae bacterium]|nr:hypothetical protein [Terrimicrobiaceae bacterium]
MDAIPVTPLPPSGSRDWEALRRGFRGRPALELSQAWREIPEPLFAPGRVRVALAGMSLAVFATLRDRDVFNPVTHSGVPAFPHGDTFEIFLQPEGQAAYYEFHVTPGAALLQLRWPAPMRTLALDWTAPADPLRAYRITRWRIRARARAVPAGWEVHAEIPLRRIFEERAPWHGSRVRVNFARYDYTRGRLQPVLSSTAPLGELDFHRAADWPRLDLRFC